MMDVRRRAGGLHSRTIEVLDQCGIADRLLSQGQVGQVAQFAWVPLDISDFPTRHNYGLGLWQNHIERILADWVGELAVTIYRGREVTGFTQDETGVGVALSDGQSLLAEYVVGCDGGRSLVRKAAGIEFPGWDPGTSSLIAEVEMAEEPEWGLRRDALGVHALGRVEYEVRDGEGHPLLGRRMPDLDLVTANVQLRVFTLLHDARPVLLNLGESGCFDITGWADRVQLIEAEYVGTWELPVLGGVTAPTAVLIRLDGCVAWVGDLTQLGLADALTTWPGAPDVRSVKGHSRLTRMLPRHDSRLSIPSFSHNSSEFPCIFDLLYPPRVSLVHLIVRCLLLG